MGRREETGEREEGTGSRNGEKAESRNGEKADSRKQKAGTACGFEAG
jgi:hypothetical protein